MPQDKRECAQERNRRENVRQYALRRESTWTRETCREAEGETDVRMRGGLWMKKRVCSGTPHADATRGETDSFGTAEEAFVK